VHGHRLFLELPKVEPQNIKVTNIKAPNGDPESIPCLSGQVESVHILQNLSVCSNINTTLSTPAMRPDIAAAVAIRLRSQPPRRREEDGEEEEDA
jgi:hypothetical protein